MPFYANTPESRISRSDSKNPSTTCKGITSSGRPCRRPVGPDVPNSPSKRPTASAATTARVDDPSDEVTYCWQHKSQARLSAKSSPGPTRMSWTPIREERTSLDTLADRLGLLAAEGQPERLATGRPSAEKVSAPKPAMTARPPLGKERWSCCCFRVPLEDAFPPPRPQAHPLRPDRMSCPVPAAANDGGRKQQKRQRKQASLIFDTLPLHTASQLRAELAKPISPQDEAGYIYIFWLTPESQPPARAAETARYLLSPPSARPSGQRRTSDVLASLAALNSPSHRSHDSGAVKSNKVLLKIGRATNVQRRLNEWQRQCGYNISLVRYYPYVPSSSPVSQAAVSRKTPHSHKVERLVHIELAGLNLRATDRDKCRACGKEHREWFEVDASTAAVKHVDAVVRRWVDWDESNERLSHTNGAGRATSV